MTTDTSIMCYDGLCQACDDDQCEHHCHYRNLAWKRRAEKAFMRLGIAALPFVAASQFLDGFLFVVAAVASGITASLVAEWFEKDWVTDD